MSTTDEYTGRCPLCGHRSSINHVCEPRESGTAVEYLDVGHGFQCQKCGQWFTGTHTCPPGDYRQLAGEYTVVPPWADIAAALMRLADAHERIATVQEWQAKRQGMPR